MTAEQLPGNPRNTKADMLTPLQLGVGGAIVGIATVLLVAMWIYMYSQLDQGTLTGK